MRKNLLTNGELYHIVTKSIANFCIFNDNDEFSRMMNLLRYYQIDNNLRYSDFIELKFVEKVGFETAFNSITKGKKEIVKIITYCLMPTHPHLILKQQTDHGISIYMSNILNSYTKYFNIKHKRKGPLWESEFKNIRVKNDEQLLHLTRYIHLNPSTAQLVNKPEHWPFSSYKEYLSETDTSLTEYNDILEISPVPYRKFVNNRISYQRELAKIKNLIIE